MFGAEGLSRRDTQRDGGIVHGIGHAVGGDRFDHQRQRLPRAEQPPIGRQRNDREVVLRVAEERSLLLADTDDKADAGDLDRFLQRIDVGREAIGESKPSIVTSCPRSTSTALIMRPRSTLKVEKSA